MFLILSLLHYLIIEKTVKKNRGQLFISYTMAGMLLKMFASIAVLLVYKYHKMPPDGKFVIPFLIIYLFFTTFETWFMMQLAGRKP
jgi:cation transporter-like permease